MQLDGVDLVDRYNNPGVNAKVAIRTQFLNNGEYIDPYDISACTIFNKYANTSPTSILDPGTQLIKSGLPLSPNSLLGVLMSFGVSGDPDSATPTPHDGDVAEGNVTSEHLEDEAWFPEYEPGNQASGIFRIGTGDYVAVLDGSRDLSGALTLNYTYPGGVEVKNGASAVAEYIDVWTVKLYAESEYQVFINSFTLKNDTFLTLTEPLLLTPSNRLHTKHLNIGYNNTLQDLVITTNLTVQNRNLTDAVRNIIQDYGISDVEVKIDRVVEGTALPSTISVQAAPTVGVRVTSDNTIIFPLALTPESAPGTYVIQVYYEFLSQKITSRPMYFTVE